MRLIAKVYATHKAAKKAFNDMWKDLWELPYCSIKCTTTMEIQASDDVTFRFISEDRIEGERGMQYDAVIINETINDYTLRSVLMPSVTFTKGRII